MEGSRLMMASRCVAFPPPPVTGPRPRLLSKGTGVQAFGSCSCAFFNNGTEYLRTRKFAVKRKEQRGLTVKGLFGLGVPELVVIAGVTALIFGPKKLPEIGRSIGKTVKSFQQAAKEFETEVKRESEPPTTELPKAESSAVPSDADEKNIQI